MIDADAPGHDGPECEFAIPVEIPARVLATLAGDGDVHAVVVRNGVVLHAPGELNLGRSTRLANRAQRRALRGLYRRCAIPDGTVQTHQPTQAIRATTRRLTDTGRARKSAFTCPPSRTLRCVKVVMMMHTDVQTPTFDEFFLAEFPRLVSILTAWSGERAVAEDLAQDALLQAHRNWDVVAALDRPGAWVRRVALNRSSNQHRGRRRERTAMTRIRSDRPIDVVIPTADDQLWAHVRSLPAAQRDATIMRYVDDLPLADIAAVLGCSDGTVKTHLQRARRTLARHLTMDAEAPR